MFSGPMTATEVMYRRQEADLRYKEYGEKILAEWRTTLGAAMYKAWLRYERVAHATYTDDMRQMLEDIGRHK